MTTVLCVPQWQGSSSPHAQRLAAGARQTASLFPAAARIDVQALDGLDGPVYVHVDLDVLDPAEFKSVCYREPEGVSVQRVVDLIAQVDHIVGASITEHAPRDDADLAHDAEVARCIGSALCR